MSRADEMNAQALAEEIRKLILLHAEDAVRFQTMERNIAMLGIQLRQLQKLFATRTVARGSGPTGEK